MAALPLPAAILDDLICGTGNEVIQDGGRKRKGRHFSTTTTMGIEKAALYYSNTSFYFGLSYMVEYNYRHHLIVILGINMVISVATYNACYSKKTPTDDQSETSERILFAAHISNLQTDRLHYINTIIWLNNRIYICVRSLTVFRFHVGRKWEYSLRERSCIHAKNKNKKSTKPCAHSPECTAYQ